MDNPLSSNLRSTLAVRTFVVGSVMAIVISAAPAQAPKQQVAEPAAKPPSQRVLQGDDAKRAAELEKAIAGALKADRWDEAIARAEELFALRLRVQGPKHFETVNDEWRLKALRRVAPMPHEDRVAYQSASAMNREAVGFYAQGKYTQAQPLFEKALEIRRRLLTDDHPETAESYGNLGSNLKAQGKYTVAQPLHERALELSRRLLSDDHPDTIASYNSLAVTFNAQGKYAQAQPLYEKALEICRRLLTDDHADTARSYNNLAFNLYSQGKYDLAQPLYQKALEISRRLLTDDDPFTISVYINLAANLNAQGRSAEAQPLYEKALEISRRLLTDDHPFTATAYNNLAANLYSQGRYTEAQPLYGKALEIRRRLFTDDHPNTADSYNNLASNLKAQGKYAEAQPLYEKALEIRRRLLTDDHPNTATSYNNVANNLDAQGKYAEARPLYGKALEISRRLLTDDHPFTATVYNNLAANLDSQGRYPEAQPLHEKALEIRRRLLTDEHPGTASSYNNLAANFYAQGKYAKARDRWMGAVKSLDRVRLRIAFAGLERAGRLKSPRAALAAVLARLGQPAEAWQTLEEDLGRGLLDEMAARQDRRLEPAERDRLRELTTELERLDRLVETTPKELNQAERAKRFEDLKHKRELASIALGELQTKLARDHGPLAGQVAGLGEIQAALPADAALIAWIDILPLGPNPADPDGEHWGVVVRSRAPPSWVSIAGNGPHGHWSKDDSGLADQVRTKLRRRPDDGWADLRPLIARLRTQRLEPLARALGAAAVVDMPPARRLIVLPSGAMAGIPIETLLASDDPRTVSYAPSATVFKLLRERPLPDRHAGLLALGAPVYERPDKPNDPKPPDHGLLVNVVVPGSNAATRGLKPGDVLLSYNGTALHKREDLKATPEPGRPVPVDFWRGGKVDRVELATGKLGVALDPRPAPLAIVEERKLRQVLAAVRSGSEEFEPLPGTRYEVEALARLFQADNRPARILLGADASEPTLDGLATSGDLGRFGVIHLATHAVINEGVPARSAVILTQTELPDPLQQTLNNKPVFDGRLSVREIQRGWELKVELVTLSACETALGRDAGGEGFVGFTQALLMSGARSVCLSLWKVNDRATSLLMKRFYQNWLGKPAELAKPLSKAEALREAKQWLRGLSVAGVEHELDQVARGAVEVRDRRRAVPTTAAHPYEHPYYWAGFILVGDPS